MSNESTLPDLTQDRVDAMYSDITDRIERHEREGRTKRRRNLIAAASVIAVVGLGGAVVTGTVVDQRDAGSDSSSAGVASMEQAPAPNAATEGAAEDAGSADPSRAGSGVGDVDASDDVREIITTASARLIVDDPSRAADDLSRWAESAGGRVESRSEYSSNDTAVTDLRLRVPSDRTSAATDRLRDAGKVDRLTIDTEDVTAQGVDLDARIGALETSVERLRTLMSKATTTADLLRAEETLANRQGQLESLQAQRRALSGQVAMATYEVELRTDAQETSDDNSGFVDGLKNGWDGLVTAVGVGAAAVGFLIPWLALLALLVAAYVGLRRVIRR